MTSDIKCVPSSINAACLRLFSAVVYSEAESSISFKEDNELSSKLSMLLSDYRVAVSAAAVYAIKEIESRIRITRRTSRELNATFYRKWIDVISKTRFELFVDQLMHYVSTYGTNHIGPAYIPALAGDLEIDTSNKELEITVFGTIEPTKLKDQCWSLISGGTALNSFTIVDCIDILDWIGGELDVNAVKNKEAKARLILRQFNLGELIACEPEEFLRAMVFGATNSTLLIKNFSVISGIESGRKYDVSKAFTDYGLERMAIIFNRYKPIFIAFKRGNREANSKVINAIARLSKTKHKPLAQNPLNFVSSHLLISSEMHWLNSATVSAKLRALNACSLAMHEQHGFKYNIRNGKSWIADYARSPESIKAASANFEILMKNLKETIGPRFLNKRVYIPEGVEYALPTSEKQMIGNIPLGTKFSVPSSRSVAIGIYWDKDCRCDDLDLSGASLSGEQISWNSSYKSGPFVYSGDMTSVTEHGATEYILCKARNKDEKGDRGTQLRVNCFSGNCANHEFDIILGTGDDVNQQYMMNPQSQIMNIRYKSISAMSTIGFVLQTDEYTTFILSPGNVGDSSVAVRWDSPLWMEKSASNAMIHSLKYGYSLNQLLEEFGAIVTHDKKDLMEVDINLGLDEVNKDFYNMLYED